MERVGEIVESCTTFFTAGSYELLEAPAFGALVRAQTQLPHMAVYGLVYDIRTGSKEPGGRAIVRGRTYSGRTLYDAEIYQEHPDLAEVLQTEFSALTVGFVEQKQMYHYLPPHTPPVHYSVYMCDTEELSNFGHTCDFFRMVLLNGYVSGDELLAATIRHIAQTRRDQHAYLVQAGRQVASLLKDDYSRLRAFLEKIKPGEPVGIRG